MPTNSIERQIQEFSVSEVKPHPHRLKKSNRSADRALEANIGRNGLIEPIIIDENNCIFSGHRRWEAIKRLGFEELSVIQIFGLTSAEKQAFMLAANQIPRIGDYDEANLHRVLSEFVVECDFELISSGFEAAEIDLVLQTSFEDDAASQAEALEAAFSLEPTVSRPGDLWILGEHRLYCGSLLDAASWENLLEGSRAKLCITDPPYNVRISGHVSSKNHREFAMASGEMTTKEFQEFLHEGLRLAAAFSEDGALHYIAMDHAHLDDLFAAANPIYSRRLNVIVWSKTNAGMGSFYRSAHEFFALYKVGKAPHTNNVQLGRFGRNRSNVWTYAGANTFRKGRDEDLADHPTVKPTDMIADAIMDASETGDIVIDGFGGSGTLILACEKTRRRARVIELDPAYVDVAIRRFEALTGEHATLHSTNQTFDEVRTKREIKLLPAPELFQEDASNA